MEHGAGVPIVTVGEMVSANRAAKTALSALMQPLGETDRKPVCLVLPLNPSLSDRALLGYCRRNSDDLGLGFPDRAPFAIRYIEYEEIYVS
jgi:hypothetical protein